MTTGARLRFTFVDSFLWAIRVAALIIIVWGLAGSITNTIDGQGLSGSAWRDLIITGLTRGSMYGLIALGYSMVYGVLGFINFAHGEVFMSGALVGFFAADALAENGMWDDNPILAIAIVLIVSIATSTLVAVLVERIAYRALRGAPRLIPLITSIGMSFFLQYSFRGLFGANIKRYPQPPDALQGKIDIAAIPITKVQLIVIVSAAIAMVGLFLFVTRTRTGKAMRAVAEDKEIAALMGVDVNRTIVTTFAIGGAMAGVAGTLWGLLFRQVFFFTGFLPGIKAFTAAVLGGIGNMVGAYAGGITLGVFEALGPQVILGGLEWQLAWPWLVVILLGFLGAVALFNRHILGSRVFQALVGTGAVLLLVTALIPGLRESGLAIEIPGLSQLTDVVAFTALVLVLIFRPTGLLGERLSVEDRA